MSTTWPDEATLRAVIEQLAPIQRLPTSPGEQQAALLLAERLRGLGCEAAVEEEPAHGSYAWPVGALSALGVLAGLFGRRRRWLGALGGTVAAAGIADDVSYGPKVFRRLASPRRTAYNVVATAGDRAATRTLVVLAHHDAAPSGVVFDQTVERKLVRRFPDVAERLTENPPLWWPVVGAPLLVALGSALGSRRLRRVGIGAGAIATAAFADIGSRRAVPGANDNLSGVAVLVATAEALRDRPVRGLRVLLVSAGAEEALQEGIRGFARRHFPDLPRESTWFLNHDTVGSPHLVMLEGEGPLVMEDYTTAFKDLVSSCAADLGIEVARGLRSRNSTDGVVPNRAGYPSVTLVSIDDDKLLPNYHLYTDTPDNVDYGTVADAARLTDAVARSLAG